MIERRHLLAAVLGMIGIGAQGAEPVRQVDPPRSAVHKALIVETVYPFKVIALEPAVVVQPVAKPAAAFDSPEAAMAAHFSAMQGADFEWFMSTWTASSQTLMRRRDQQLSRAPAYWLEQWRNVYAGKRIELVNRIEYGSYVLIEYALYARGANQPGFRDTVALRQENGSWKLTQELAREPILAHWNSSAGRIQVAPTSLLSDSERRASEASATPGQRR